MLDLHEWFIAACLEAFAPLVTEFDFEEPVVKPLGREVFVKYHKGAVEISVSVEPGASPLVEFFYPVAGTSDEPVPWMERNGVARARRFPKVAVSRPFNADDHSDYARFVGELYASVRSNEADFLSLGER